MQKFALITLRNDHIVGRGENRDSLDIEVYSLVLDLGLIPILVPNLPSLTIYFDRLLKKENIGLVLFSGGNDLLKFKKEIGTNVYKKRDELELNMIKYCTINSIPIFSICRGFQFIANYFGANIERLEGHINVNHEIYIENSKEKILVNSFHSFGLKYKNLPIQIKPLAIHKSDNSIEAFTTKEPFNSLNIMWHPERNNGAKLKTCNLIKEFLFTNHI